MGDMLWYWLPAIPYLGGIVGSLIYKKDRIRNGVIGFIVGGLIAALIYYTMVLNGYGAEMNPPGINNP